MASWWILHDAYWSAQCTLNISDSGISFIPYMENLALFWWGLLISWLIHSISLIIHSWIFQTVIMTLVIYDYGMIRMKLMMNCLEFIYSFGEHVTTICIMAQRQQSPIKADMFCCKDRAIHLYPMQWQIHFLIFKYIIIQHNFAQVYHSFLWLAAYQTIILFKYPNPAAPLCYHNAISKHCITLMYVSHAPAHDTSLKVKMFNYSGPFLVYIHLYTLCSAKLVLFLLTRYTCKF